jgi:hypothetical protein
MFRFRVLSLFLISALGIGAAGCSGDSPDQPETTPPPAHDTNITPQETTTPPLDVQSPAAREAELPARSPLEEADDTPDTRPPAPPQVRHTVPQGWVNLNRDGRQEIFSAGRLISDSWKLPIVASIADRPLPHLTSGTDEEWTAWRQDVGAAIAYRLPEPGMLPGEELAAVLIKYGSMIVPGFDEGRVKPDERFATHVSDDGFLVMVIAADNVLFLVTGTANHMQRDAQWEQIVAWARTLRLEEPEQTKDE